MITFKILNQKAKFPTSWNDVTYAQSLFLLQYRTLKEMIGLFTGIPDETLERAEIKNLEKINIALAFMSVSPKFERTAKVGPYILPADVTLQSLGQFEDLRGLIRKLPQKKQEEFTTEDHEKLYDLYLSACAIYVQKVKDGKYDYTKVDAIKEELKQFSCIEVIGTGAFFLYRPLNISLSSMNPFLMLIHRLKRLIVGLPGYQKTLDFLLRSSR